MVLNRYKIFFIVFVIGLLGIGGLFVFKNSEKKSDMENNAIFEANGKNSVGFLYSLKINNAVLNIEIADTTEKREDGLSGRENLPENQGMLFPFEKEDYYSFWMKDMDFPIDIIWIGNDLKIVDIAENISPKTYPKNFKPSRPAKYAIETNAYWIRNNNIKIGDYIPLDGISSLYKAEYKFEEIKTAEEEVESETAGQKSEIILYDVPFTSQAPLGNWRDLRQENGCEEASAIMAMAWVRGKGKFVPAEAEKEIIRAADYELEKYGDFHDTSARDTAERIFKDYFKYADVEVKYDIGAEDIKKELLRGNLAVVPVNGQKLENPFYKPPGPIVHMIVIIGYDGASKEFITNDPGTRHGENFRYKEEVLEGALQDYPTGFHEPIEKIRTAMIVVGR